MLLVWVVRTIEYTDTIPRLLDGLSASERQRASALHFDRDRASYVVSHYALRRILAHHLKMNRFEHEYEIGTHGKPSLPPQFSASNLEFSLAHADEIALIAVSNLGAVGIDVEREVDSFNVHELAVSVFDRQECQLLANFSAGAAKRGFFRMWVRKEAYAKACGLGLSAGLKVPVLDPTALDDVGRVQIRHAGGKTWLEWAVTSQPGYSAALYQRVDDMARTAHVVPEIREWRLSHLERT